MLIIGQPTQMMKVGVEPAKLFEWADNRWIVNQYFSDSLYQNPDGWLILTACQPVDWLVDWLYFMAYQPS